MASRKLPILVVAGVGTGGGTGGSTARLFAKNGYAVAVLGRDAGRSQGLIDEIKANGGDAAQFTVPAYTHDAIETAFDDIKKHWKDPEIRVAVWNAAFGAWKPFLEVKPEEIAESVQNNIVGPFAFARESILAFKDLELNAIGKRGTLIFTGATASIRGNTTTSAFATGKHGLRALSQSLAKEFGPQNIHVAHSIIDGGIKTDRRTDEKSKDPDAVLQPDSIANAYLYLTNQDRSAFTWELDLRPSHEKW